MSVYLGRPLCIVEKKGCVIDGFCENRKAWNDAKNEEYLKNNLELKDKILKLQNEKKILEDEKLKLDQEFDEINKKVEGLINIIKNSYYE